MLSKNALEMLNTAGGRKSYGLFINRQTIAVGWMIAGILEATFS
jgi:hypothetical protein